MDVFNNKQIVILSIGWGLLEKERMHSIKYASNVFNILRQNGFRVRLHNCNSPDDIIRLRNESNLIVYNCLFGRFGEDGVVQSILEFLGISYTGSGPLACAIAMNKGLCNRIIRPKGFSIPDFVIIENYKSNMFYKSVKPSNEIRADSIVYKKLIDINSKRYIIKPLRSAFSTGVSVIDDLSKLDNAIKIALNFDHGFILQEFIDGKTIHVPVLCGQALEPIEAIPELGLDSLPKHYIESSSKTYIVPSRLRKKVIIDLKKTAELIHHELGCRGLTRIDFIVSNGNHIYFIEVNTQHSLRESSMLALSANYSGMKQIEIVTKIIQDRWIPE